MFKVLEILKPTDTGKIPVPSSEDLLPDEQYKGFKPIDTGGIPVPFSENLLTNEKN